RLSHAGRIGGCTIGADTRFVKTQATKPAPFLPPCTAQLPAEKQPDQEQAWLRPALWRLDADQQATARAGARYLDPAWATAGDKSTLSGSGDTPVRDRPPLVPRGDSVGAYDG